MSRRLRTVLSIWLSVALLGLLVFGAARYLMKNEEVVAPTAQEEEWSGTQPALAEGWHEE